MCFSSVYQCWQVLFSYCDASPYLQAMSRLSAFVFLQPNTEGIIRRNIISCLTTAHILRSARCNYYSSNFNRATQSCQVCHPVITFLFFLNEGNFFFTIFDLPPLFCHSFFCHLSKHQLLFFFNGTQLPVLVLTALNPSNSLSSISISEAVTETFVSFYVDF